MILTSPAPGRGLRHWSLRPLPTPPVPPCPLRISVPDGGLTVTGAPGYIFNDTFDGETNLLKERAPLERLAQHGPILCPCYPCQITASVVDTSEASVHREASGHLRAADAYAQLLRNTSQHTLLHRSWIQVVQSESTTGTIFKLFSPSQSLAPWHGRIRIRVCASLRGAVPVRIAPRKLACARRVQAWASTSRELPCPLG